MAKKKAKPKVPAIEAEKISKPIRLDLRPADHAKLERVARRKGLSMSSYVRMILLERLAIEEDPEQ